MKTQYSFKVTLLGNNGVGKTSLIHRYMSKSFKDYYKSTMGVQHHKKVIEINGYGVTLNVWDVSGQSKFTTFRNLFYAGTDFFIVVLDLKNPKTLEAVSLWIEDVKRLKTEEVIPRNFGIMANKRDLFDNYEKDEDTKKYVHSIRIGCMELLKRYKNDLAFFYETSARDGQNVDLLFDYVTNHLLKNSLEQNKIETNINFVELHHRVHLLGLTIEKNGVIA